ncbi:hypothetical protein MKX03_021162 [Papaver bracteatum]|nr:hypothetical protein MKX03_021162 [Papaver bracteatum]
MQEVRALEDDTNCCLEENIRSGTTKTRIKNSRLTILNLSNSLVKFTTVLFLASISLHLLSHGTYCPSYFLLNIKKTHDISKASNKDMIFIILLLLLPINPITTRADEPVYKPLCSDSTYTSNSSFEINLKDLLSVLPSSSSLSGFSSTIMGSASADDENSSNRYYVYGLALCRGNLTTEDCLICVKDASKRIIDACPYSLSATVFYEVCHVRYSNENFISKLVYAAKHPTRGDINNNIASNSWNSTKQRILDPRVYSAILDNLIKEIVSDDEASNPSGKMFTTREANLDSTSTKLYGLGQCTRDLSKEDCHRCLTQAKRDIGINEGYEGGFVVDNSCNLRYEMYPFYLVQAQPGKKKKIVTITISVSIPLLVLFVVIALSYWAYCRNNKIKRGI